MLNIILGAGSHLDYDVTNGTGHGNIKEKVLKYLPNEITYHYRQFIPMIIDARTIHGVDNNVSKDNWRWICWFIFDSYWPESEQVKYALVTSRRSVIKVTLT